MNERRWRRNFLLATAIASAVWAGYEIAGAERPVEGLSLSTAYVALGLLVITLSIGPLNVMRRIPNPVSTHLRRDFGIWTAVAAIAHTLLGLEVHLGGRFAGYFTLPSAAESPSTNSIAVFVGANYMGALAILILVVLLSLSNDVALRRLGTSKWKSLQRWSYPLLALVAVHGVVYQALEKRRVAAVLLVLLLVSAVTAIQLRGVAIRRRASATEDHQ